MHITRRIVLIACLAASVWGCKSTSASEGGQPQCAEGVEDRLAQPSSVPPEWRNCTSAEECEIVGIVCCACGADEFTAVRKEHLTAAHEILDEDCGHCPPVECPPTAAFCADRMCVAARTDPYLRAVVNGYFVAPGAPDPRACSGDEDCLGDTVLGADGCCRDPYSLLSYSRTYGAWMAARQTGDACAAVRCAAPPTPDQPDACYFQVSCVEGLCANSCPP